MKFTFRLPSGRPGPDWEIARGLCLPLFPTGRLTLNHMLPSRDTGEPPVHLIIFAHHMARIINRRKGLPSLQSAFAHAEL
jgi:hypothetical protein